MRTRGNPPRGTVRRPSGAINSGYAVRRAPTTETRTERRNIPLQMCRKRMTLPTESCCGRCSHVSVYTGQDAAVTPQFHDSMRARVSADDGEHLELFDVTPGGVSAGLRAITVAAQHVLRHCITRCPRLLQRGRRHHAEPTMALAESWKGWYAGGGPCGAWFTPTMQTLPRSRQRGLPK